MSADAPLDFNPLEDLPPLPGDLPLPGAPGDTSAPSDELFPAWLSATELPTFPGATAPPEPVAEPPSDESPGLNWLPDPVSGSHMPDPPSTVMKRPDDGSVFGDLLRATSPEQNTLPLPGSYVPHMQDSDIRLIDKSELQGPIIPAVDDSSMAALFESLSRPKPPVPVHGKQHHPKLPIKSEPPLPVTPVEPAAELAVTGTETPPPVESTADKVERSVDVIETTPALESPGVTRTTRQVTIKPVLEESGTMIVYRLVLRSELGSGYRDTRVSFPLPSGVKQVHASRKPLARKGRLHWELGNIRARESVSISVKFPLDANNHDWLERERTFEITYLTEDVAILVCNTDGPEIVGINEPFLLKVAIANQGDRESGRITVRATPRNLTGKHVETVLEPLPQGMSATAELNLVSQRLGKQEWRLQIVAGGAELVEKSFVSDCVLPTVGLNLKHESLVYLDTESEITIEMCNNSAVPARDLVLTFDVPADLAFADSPRGRFDVSASTVQWPSIELEPNETHIETLRVRGFAPGLIRLTATLKGADELEASAVSNIFCEISPQRTRSTLDELLQSLQNLDEIDAEPSSRSSIKQGERHVLFPILGNAHAIAIENVREVLRPPVITPVPGMPDWIEGVANIRGDIVSIVDLPRFLDLDSETQTRRALLITQTCDQDRVVGLLVEDVIGIRYLTSNETDVQSQFEDNRLTSYLGGLSEYENRIVPILDMDALLNSNEMNLFEYA